MLLQPYESYFILAIIKEVETHESINNWKLMKNSEVKQKHKNKDDKLKTILSIWYFKYKIPPNVILTKQRYRLFSHGGMQQWGVKYCETHAPVENWIIVRSILAIESIHESKSRSIDFVIAFAQADIDVDVFMDLPLGM